MKKLAILVLFIALLPLTTHAANCAPGDVFDTRDGGKCPISASATDTASLLAEIQSLKDIITDLKSQVASLNTDRDQNIKNKDRVKEITREISQIDLEIAKIKGQRICGNGDCISREYMNTLVWEQMEKKKNLQTEYTTITGNVDNLPQ